MGKIIIIILLAFAFSVRCYCLRETNLCKNYILDYQDNHSSDLYFPSARIEHILELISTSQDKFKLIDNIYLHYFSLKIVDNQLSLVLEKCLIGLLDTNLNNNIQVNQNSLLNLCVLSQQEQSIFGRLFLKKSDFDNLFVSKLESQPNFTQELYLAYEKIMKVNYEKHERLAEYNILLVQNFIDLLTNNYAKNKINKALSNYTRDPTPESYNLIKAKIRTIYAQLSGQPVMRSSSEIWESLLKTTDEILEEIKDADFLVRYQIFQIKRDCDSSDIESIKVATYQIISLLKPKGDKIIERIMHVFLMA